MPRKSQKAVDVDTTEPIQSAVTAFSTAPASAQPLDEAARTMTGQNDASAEATTTTAQRSRSFKSTFSVRSKGVTLGERNGHDWVIAFPEDPGRETKDKLIDAGFAYRDGKWKQFTHAANRARVESLAKELKRQVGDQVAINDYPVRQVVLAFEAPPGDDITTRLKEADFHFRPDRTWNADHNPQNQKFARDFIQSLPDMGRSVGG